MLWEIMLAAEALTTAASMTEKSKGAGARDTELQMRETQTQMRSIQEQGKEQNKMVKTLSQQASDEAVSGFDPASPTYKAISMSSFDAFLSDEHATALNAQFQQNTLEAQRASNQQNKDASMFNMLSRFGFEAFDTMQLGTSKKSSK